MNKVEAWLNADESRVRNQKQRLVSIFSQVWQQGIIWLANLGDVQVRQRIDQFGNPYWQAYNPLTGRSLCSGSELEVRMWIEQQLYQ